MITAAELFAMRRAARASHLASLQKEALSREELTEKLRNWITTVVGSLREALTAAAMACATSWITPSLLFVNPGISPDGRRHFTVGQFRAYILECGIDPLTCLQAAVGEGITVTENQPWSPDADPNPYLPQDVVMRYRFQWS